MQTDDQTFRGSAVMPDLIDILRETCSPERPAGRLALLLGEIDLARDIMLRAADSGPTTNTTREALRALRRIFEAKQAYDRAALP